MELGAKPDKVGCCNAKPAFELEIAWLQRWKLKYNKLLASFAFNLNLRPCDKGPRIPANIGIGLWRKNEEREEKKRLEEFEAGKARHHADLSSTTTICSGVVLGEQPILTWMIPGLLIGKMTRLSGIM